MMERERPKKRNDCDYNLVYNLNDHVKNQDEYIEHIEAKLKTPLSDRGAEDSILSKIDKELARLIKMSDDQAENFDKAGWETANVCSKAMAQAYRLSREVTLKAMQEYAEQGGKEKKRTIVSKRFYCENGGHSCLTQCSGCKEEEMYD